MTIGEALTILGPIRCVKVCEGVFNLYGSRYVTTERGAKRYVKEKDVIEAARELVE